MDKPSLRKVFHWAVSELAAQEEGFKSFPASLLHKCFDHPDRTNPAHRNNMGPNWSARGLRGRGESGVIQDRHDIDRNRKGQKKALDRLFKVPKARWSRYNNFARKFNKEGPPQKKSEYCKLFHPSPVMISQEERHHGPDEEDYYVCAHLLATEFGVPCVDPTYNPSMDFNLFNPEATPLINPYTGVDYVSSHPIKGGDSRQEPFETPFEKNIPDVSSIELHKLQFQIRPNIPFFHKFE